MVVDLGALSSKLEKLTSQKIVDVENLTEGQLNILIDKYKNNKKYSSQHGEDIYNPGNHYITFKLSEIQKGNQNA